MQLHLLSVLVFCVSSNMDSLVVGLSYGMKKIPIHWLTNVLVGLISFAGTILSMLFGKRLLTVIPVSFANLFGGMIIILIGAAGMLRLFIGRKSGHSGETAANVLTIRETVLLGAGLTVNNIGLGVGASITGFPLRATACCSLLCSLVFLCAGNRIGYTRLPRRFEKFAEPVADVLMILLGLYEIFI